LADGERLEKMATTFLRRQYEFNTACQAVEEANAPRKGNTETILDFLDVI
jgi:hypothetical protein